MNRLCLALAIAAATISSCYRIEESGATTTLSFNPVVAIVVATLGAVVLAAAVGMVRAGARRFGVGLAIISAFFAFFIGPGILVDRVVITPSEITQRTGYWFAPTRKGFRYVEVEAVSIRAVRVGRRTNREWFLRLAGGGERSINPGDLWENNEMLVVEKLRAYGVRFE